MTGIKTLLIFVLTAALIILLSHDFLKPVFDVGLTPEDREFILRYKLLGPNPLSKIGEVWSERGAYTTVPIYYIGMVQDIAGFNYQRIQFISVLFRTLAILSIFPLVTIIFKNIWLAFLTTIIFAFSYTTTGALETGVEPSEYLGLLMMNFFLIAYYYLNTKFILSTKLLILTSLLLFAAVMTSIMRVYPILFLLPLLELFLLFLNRNRYKFKFLFVKLAVFYLPFMLLVYFSPSSGSGHFALPSILLKVGEGNWHLLLTSLQGLGFMIPVGKYYGNLGVLTLDTFNDYLAFLLGGPLVIFGLISLVISLISAKKKIAFFLRVFLLNFGLEILTYWIVQHRLLVPVQSRLDFDIIRLYPIFFGLFILSVMVNFLIDWLRSGKKNNLLIVLWGGPLFALLFIIMTFIFAGFSLSFGGAQDHYLLIPTIGISLFIAGILLLLYKRLSTTRIKVAGGLIVVILLVFLYFLNKEITHNYFKSANFNGRAAVGQELLQKKLKEKFENFDYSKAALFFIDVSDIPDGYGPFYSEGLLTPFSTLLFSQGEKVMSGCIGIIYEDKKMDKLRKLIKTVDNQQVIVHQTPCVENSRITVRAVIYKPDNLYAFQIKDGEFIDIKDKVLSELNLK